MRGSNSSGHYGTQVKGALIMFAAVVLTAWLIADADARGAELGRRVLWYLFVGVCTVVLFVAFFVGLKVFVGGLLREMAGHLSDAGPGERGGGENPAPPV